MYHSISRVTNRTVILTSGRVDVKETVSFSAELLCAVASVTAYQCALHSAGNRTLHCDHSSCASHDQCKFNLKLPAADNVEKTNVFGTVRTAWKQATRIFPSFIPLLLMRDVIYRHSCIERSVISCSYTIFFPFFSGLSCSLTVSQKQVIFVQLHMSAEMTRECKCIFSSFVINLKY